MKVQIIPPKNGEITPEYVAEVLRVLFKTIKEQKCKDEATGIEFPVTISEINLYATTRDPDGKPVPLKNQDTDEPAVWEARMDPIYIVRPPMKKLYTDDTKHVYIYQK